MADHQAFFNVLDMMETDSAVEPVRFFERMRATFEIADLLYVDLVVHPSGLSVTRLHHTIVKIAQSDILAAFGKNGAATLRRILDGARPVDIGALCQLHPALSPGFAVAAQLGLACEGVVLPLAAPVGRSALLVMTSPLGSREWRDYYRCHLRDFQLLASLFHASMLEQNGDPGLKSGTGAPLTMREREVLGWAAAGKSYWEIATILGISERTVRFFMNNAKRKLNVVSSTQAVARAVHQALITPA